MLAAPADFRRRRTGVFLLLFGAYAAYYFGRVTVPAALPLIESTFGFSKTQTGLILSAFYTVYAASKLFNGVLADRLGGKAIILIGLAGSLLCNVAFGFGGELAAFVAIWGANAFFQSMGWLGIVPVMSLWYGARERGFAMGWISLSYQLGDFVARASAGALMAVLAWRGAFFGHAGILALGGLLVLLLLRPTPDGQVPQEAGGNVADSGGAAEPGYRQWVGRMLRSPWFWLVCAVYLLLSVIRYIFWGWSVQYLVDAGVRIGPAALTSAVFPLLGSAGTIFAGWVSDRMGARRGPVMAVMGAGLTASIFLFSRAATGDPLALTITLGMVGFCLYGPYALMAGAIAIDFGSTRASATAAGIIDSVGAVGAIITGVGMGYLIDQYGWNNAFSLVGAMALVTTGLTATLWNMRPLSPQGPEASLRAA